jgi:hypothetical protein
MTLTYHQVHVDSPLEVANWNTQEDSRTMFVVEVVCQRKEKKTTTKTQYSGCFFVYRKIRFNKNT